MEVLIYVFDVEKEGKAYEDEMADYRTTLEKLSIYSKDAIVFVLIHKFDKIKDSEKNAVFEVIEIFYLSVNSKM